MREGLTLSNWSGNVTTTVSSFVEPKNVDELKEIIKNNAKVRNYFFPKNDKV